MMSNSKLEYKIPPPSPGALVTKNPGGDILGRKSYLIEMKKIEKIEEN